MEFTMVRINAMKGTLVVSVEEGGHFVKELLLELRREKVLEGLVVERVRHIRKGIVGDEF